MSTWRIQAPTRDGITVPSLQDEHRDRCVLEVSSRSAPPRAAKIECPYWWHSWWHSSITVGLTQSHSITGKDSSTRAPDAVIVAMEGD
jgi:hypothetical protein